MAFNAKADCEALHKAFKGLGTDEKAVINILAHRTKAQLLAIAAEYPQTHKHSLEENLKSELSGHFRDLCIDLVTPQTKVRIAQIKRATKGLGTREISLIDVLVGSTNEEIKAMLHEDPRIIADVLNDVSGDFKAILNELFKASRETTPCASDAEAQATAEQLYKAGEGKLGTDEKVFTSVFAKRSPAFLERVDYFYKSAHKHGLDKAVCGETSGYYEKTLLALLKPRHAFIADRLFEAMKGAGTDDVALVYWFSTLEKSELHEVARVFQQRHSKEKSLAEMIKGDTSGDYRDLLIALLSA